MLEETKKGPPPPLEEVNPIQETQAQEAEQEESEQPGELQEEKVKEIVKPSHKALQSRDENAFTGSYNERNRD